jgi:hypothetical protein
VLRYELRKMTHESNMKYLTTILLVMGLPTANASASDATRKALMKEYDQLQDRMHECMVAMANATRHNNIWQEDNLSIEECKARAYESIDLGQRMIRDSAKSDDE